MIIKQDKDRYNNRILKFSPQLNSTKYAEKRALRMLYNNQYEYWQGIGWIGKENDRTDDLVKRIGEITGAEVRPLPNQLNAAA